MALDTPSGIAGFEGREPIQATLSLSVKDERNGAPSQKDRLHIMTAALTQKEYQKNGGGTYKAPAREYHPSFASFNAAPPDKRRAIPARIGHITAAECFELRLQCASMTPAQLRAGSWTNANGAQVRALPAHPQKGPSCIGNGQIANRWNGTEYERIPCPGETCIYSAKGPISSYTKQPEKSPCGPWMRFVGRFDWDPIAARDKDGAPVLNADGSPKMVRFPNVVFKLTSMGWNTAKEFKGFFDAFDRACAGFGVDPLTVPLWGMPVTITLEQRRNMDTSPPSVFPVASIAMRGDIDLITWIGNQLEQGSHLRQLAARAPMIALTDRSQQAPEVLNADYEVVAPPTIAQPGQG